MSFRVKGQVPLASPFQRRDLKDSKRPFAKSASLWLRQGFIPAEQTLQIFETEKIFLLYAEEKFSQFQMADIISFARLIV